MTLDEFSGFVSKSCRAPAGQENAGKRVPQPSVNSPMQLQVKLVGSSIVLDESVWDLMVSTEISLGVDTAVLRCLIGAGQNYSNEIACKSIHLSRQGFRPVPANNPAGWVRQPTAAVPFRVAFISNPTGAPWPALKHWRAE